jgi:putative spermidine/putrescine transport system ATP-binding protein
MDSADLAREMMGMATAGQTSVRAAGDGRPAAKPDAEMVRVDAVSCVYGSTRAVDRVSFTLARGRFLTILGPSGSGKTTLLRMIAGFIAPSEGQIHIAGRAVASVPAYQRSIGMVFQRLALFPHMTAAENIAYPLKMRRFDRTTIPDRVERYLALVRLPGYGTRRVHELSGGQQQRIAIARALVFEPDLLLLDEPLAALDRKLREDMQLEFRRIQQELGVTTINVTHDQREALVMSDEIMVMEAGRVEQMGRPVDTYHTPATSFVAGFIGVTNFLAGVVAGRAGPEHARIRVGARELRGRCPAGVALGDGRPVDCALRAEQVRLALSIEELRGLDTVLPGTVREAIFEGDRIVYGVECADLGNAVLRIFDYDPLRRSPYAGGDHVHIGWNAADLMIFPHPDH